MLWDTADLLTMFAIWIIWTGWECLFSQTPPLRLPCNLVSLQNHGWCHKIPFLLLHAQLCCLCQPDDSDTGDGTRSWSPLDIVIVMS